VLPVETTPPAVLPLELPMLTVKGSAEYVLKSPLIRRFGLQATEALADAEDDVDDVTDIVAESVATELLVDASDDAEFSLVEDIGTEEDSVALIDVGDDELSLVEDAETDDEDSVELVAVDMEDEPELDETTEPGCTSPQGGC
jgi:hypothetical protein